MHNFSLHMRTSTARQGATRVVLSGCTRIGPPPCKTLHGEDHEASLEPSRPFRRSPTRPSGCPWNLRRAKGEQATFSKINYFDGKPAHPRVYALRLADGGALDVFPTSYTIEFLHKRYMSGGRIIPGETEAIYNSERRPVVTDEYQGQALAALAPSRKPEVITWRYAMVDSR